MTPDITFLGHAGFLLSDGSYTIAVDPFLTGNPIAVHQPDQIKCQYVALTHGHADHFGDTLHIAKANNATVIAAFELCNYCNQQGITNTEPGNPGGRIYTPFGFIGFTPAFHSSSYDGCYMGQPTGLIINIAGISFYHAGDTALFSDMKLIGQIEKPLVAAIPVGDRFTMSPRTGSMAAEFVKPEIAIPIHYKTFPLLNDDIAEFKPHGVQVKILEPGQTLTL